LGQACCWSVLCVQLYWSAYKHTKTQLQTSSPLAKRSIVSPPSCTHLADLELATVWGVKALREAGRWGRRQVFDELKGEDCTRADLRYKQGEGKICGARMCAGQPHKQGEAMAYAA